MVTINSPNDILALSYIKEIIKNNYEIVPVSIKRTNDYHGDTVSSNIINASLLRKLFYEEKNIKKYIPNYNLDYLNKISLNDYFYYLKYQIINNKNRLSEIQTVDEGIENRILKQINDASSWTDLVEKIKTKRYTYNKINRMLVHILTNFTKEEAHNIKVDYLRILGFSKKGRLYLNKIKKDIDLPIITHYKKNISNILDIEFRVVEIYDLVAKQDLIKKEYSQKPLFKD